MNTSPAGLFITWTVYGTHLPGDACGWRHRQTGSPPPRPRLELWHRNRLQHEVITLDDAMRQVAEAAIVEICAVRAWSLWAVAVRSNHVHVVVTAPEYDPELVRDQLKAKATRELRRASSIWNDRPVWSTKGDIEFLDSEPEIEQCVLYTAVAQDRKDRDT
jgi:REP element-mobilizing transposase RayT